MRHSFLAFLIIFTFGTAPLAAQTVSPEVLSYPEHDPAQRQDRYNG